jgi:hypothetical protein
MPLVQTHLVRILFDDRRLMLQEVLVLGVPCESLGLGKYETDGVGEFLDVFTPLGCGSLPTLSS